MTERNDPICYFDIPPGKMPGKISILEIDTDAPLSSLTKTSLKKSKMSKTSRNFYSILFLMFLSNLLGRYQSSFEPAVPNTATLMGVITIENTTPCQGEVFRISYSDECTNDCCEFNTSYSISGNRIELIGDKLPDSGFCNFVITPYTLNFDIDESNLSGTYEVYYNGINQNKTVTVGGPSFLGIDGDQEVEATMSITLSADVTGGISPYSYNWNINNFDGAATISPNGDQVTLTGQSAGDVLLSLTVTDNNGCSIEQSEQITITPEIVCTVAGGTIRTPSNQSDLAFCSDDSTPDLLEVTLTDNMGSFSYWVITDQNKDILELPSNFPIDFGGAEAGTYIVQHIGAGENLSTALTIGTNLNAIVGCYDLSNEITVTILTGSNCGVLEQTMILVHGGAIDMGCTDEQGDNCDLPGATNEVPVHEIKIPGFYLNEHEVTQQEWEIIMGNNPAFFGPGNSDGRQCSSDCPMDFVSWYDALVFCNRLSELVGLTPCYYSDVSYSNIFGKTNGIWSQPQSEPVFWNENANGYRLPTEAEWEFAAKGGNYLPKYIYAGSDNIDEVAVYGLNFTSGMPAPVGSKSPNRLGIHDMSGSVEEWLWDYFQDDYYGDSPRCFPTGPDSGPKRVVRGGGWGADPLFCRTTDRNGRTPDIPLSVLGFRLAQNIDGMDRVNCNNICTTHPDYDALVAFFNAMGGNSWTDRTGWFKASNDENCDPCSWRGISCNPDGRVTKIELPNNNLSGSLSTSIATLTNLTTLDLGQNELTGTIPTEILELPNLTSLILSENNFAGNLPVTLGNINSLITLDLSGNNFNGDLPENLSGLLNLDTLLLQNNQFTGCFPTSYSTLCSQLGHYNFTGNPNLSPNQGDFELFCNAGDLSCCENFRVTEVSNAPNCKGDLNGMITLTVQNGIGPYNYNWTNGADNGNGSGVIISNLPSGNYDITLSDTGTSCEATLSIIIPEGPELLLDCRASNRTTSIGASDGIGLVNITNGSATFTISWEGPANGSITNGGNGDNNIPGLGAGSYTVTVVDANGCTNNCLFTILDPDCSLDFTLEQEDPNCNLGSDGHRNLPL